MTTYNKDGFTYNDVPRNYYDFLNNGQKYCLINAMADYLNGLKLYCQTSNFLPHQNHELGLISSELKSISKNLIDENSTPVIKSILRVEDLVHESVMNLDDLLLQGWYGYNQPHNDCDMYLQASITKTDYYRSSLDRYCNLSQVISLILVQFSLFINDESQVNQVDFDSLQFLKVSNLLKKYSFKKLSSNLNLIDNSEVPNLSVLALLQSFKAITEIRMAENKDNKIKAYQLKKKGNLVLNQSKPLALSYYSQALSFEPNNPGILSNRAAIFQSLDSHSDAIKDLKKAVELNPGYAVGYSRLAFSYLYQGRSLDAATNYANALKASRGTLLPNSIKNQNPFRIRQYVAKIRKQTLETFTYNVVRGFEVSVDRARQQGVAENSLRQVQRDVNGIIQEYYQRSHTRRFQGPTIDSSFSSQPSGTSTAHAHSGPGDHEEEPTEYYDILAPVITRFFNAATQRRSEASEGNAVNGFANGTANATADGNGASTAGNSDTAGAGQPGVRSQVHGIPINITQGTPPGVTQELPQGMQQGAFVMRFDGQNSEDLIRSVFSAFEGNGTANVAGNTSANTPATSNTPTTNSSLNNMGGNAANTNDATTSMENTGVSNRENSNDEPEDIDIDDVEPAAIPPPSSTQPAPSRGPFGQFGSMIFNAVSPIIQREIQNVTQRNRSSENQNRPDPDVDLD